MRLPVRLLVAALVVVALLYLTGVAQVGRSDRSSSPADAAATHQHLSPRGQSDSCTQPDGAACHELPSDCTEAQTRRNCPHLCGLCRDRVVVDTGIAAGVLPSGLNETLLGLRRSLAALVDGKPVSLDPRDQEALMTRMGDIASKVDALTLLLNMTRSDILASMSLVAAETTVRPNASEPSEVRQAMLNATLTRLEGKVDELLQRQQPPQQTTQPTPSFTVEPRIPKKIHQTWKVATVPPGQLGAVNSWQDMNPGYTHTLHTDEDMLNMMRTYYPEVMPAWARMKPVEKADTFRYAILHKEGGYYADLDVTCVRPIREWMPHFGHDPALTDLVVGFEVVTERPDWMYWYARKFEFCQWTMGAVAGHPALRRVLDKIIEFYEVHTDAEIENGPQNKPQTINATGPGIWSDAVHEWLGEQHHVFFDENKTVPGETHYDPWVARNGVIRAGNATILPVRAFGMNSGGYQLRPEHSPDDILVRHAYLGSWKRKETFAPTPQPTMPVTTTPPLRRTRAAPATLGIKRKRHARLASESKAHHIPAKVTSHVKPVVQATQSTSHVNPATHAHAHATHRLKRTKAKRRTV
eukprot:m.28025 g.28025  ORF g.28025 m.28025 type:complete len:582 (+) comp4477_c0_seq1:49-1794(+)